MFRFGKMQPFEVTTNNCKDVETQDLLKNDDQVLTAINITGSHSEDKDIPVYRDVAPRCVEYLTKLKLRFVKLSSVDGDQITKFPNLKELDLQSSELSFNFLKFNEWCPNLETLTIKNVEFREGPDDDWISLAEQHPSPSIRNLTIEMIMDNNDEVYFYFEALEKQFPMLESLYLEFDRDFTLNKYVPCFGADSKITPYESLYFENLKKLTVNAFGKCDDIFNYLSISNEKLKEIHFMGMNADKILITSLCNYPKLTKLYLDCPYVYENELGVLCAALTKLQTLVLDCKYFHWKAPSMMNFIQNAKSLRHLKIDVDRKGGKLQIGDEFKKQFEALIVAGRKFLTLDFKCFESSQEIHLSRKRVSDRPPSPSLDESNGWF